ncbi:DedA family protein [bacterium]|nr:DedA family protein [bacterium]
MSVLQTGGYPGIVLLMAMESSVFPIPSELVIPPAAYWASQGKMSYFGVVAAGTLGCWIGSALTYWVSNKVGRPVLIRYGKYVLISPEKLELAEEWVQDYGREGVFFARLLPVVRHLIGIPAGLTGMNFLTFSWTTVLGSAIWCSVLAWFGPQIITPEMFQDADSMVKAMKARTHMVALLVGLVAVLYGVMRYMTRKKAS